jgi:hypothetical protein
MEQIETFLRPAIDLLPKSLQDYWLVLVGTVALVILLPLAWYKRRLLRSLIKLPRRAVREMPKLEEDLAQLVPPPELPGSGRLFVEGVPARLRLAVVASPGKSLAITEASVGDVLDQVRWGLGTIARQDHAVIRVWPLQLSAKGFPAVFQRNMRKPEPEGQPSHWVLLAGPTPPRPQSVLLGLALWTDKPTSIGRLILEPSQWIHFLYVETEERLSASASPVASASPPPSPVPEQTANNPFTSAPEVENRPSA